MMWNLEVDKVMAFAYMDNVFTDEECEKIIQIGNSKEKYNAEVNNNNQFYNPSVRKNKVSWLEPEDNLYWMYKKLTDVVLNLNPAYFGFDLIGFTEKTQFSEYSEINDGFKMHLDKTFGSVIRKLTLVIQLSDPKDYEGSELILHTSSEPDVMTKKRGSVIAFPAYAMHEVRPLISGKRYSLVCWLGGPNFK